jgi:tryptophanyl-tRNA synthetase
MATEAKQALYFVADYHALTSVHDRKELDALVVDVAATWLALGLDPDKVVFYRQSDVPEIFELTWILSCFTGKGLMNRAHAYKAIVQKNQENGVDDDFGVNMGLFCYPVLMAADILLFGTDLVPVGKDQVQHVEYARDIAQSFNSVYGEVLRVPRARIGEETSVIPGLDGRKMSKSYGNTIPIFAPEKQLRKLVMRYVTDSSRPEDPKDPSVSPLFMMYKEFATAEETEQLRKRYLAGVGWGEVKQELFTVLNRALAEPRRKYDELMADRARVDALLEAGKKRAHELASSTLRDVRKAIGIDR